MFRADEILSMLDWKQPESVQAQGRLLAREAKDLCPFLRPQNVGTWENCAKILAERRDEELTPHLLSLFEWLASIEWPGAQIIEQRLKYFENEVAFHEALTKSLTLAENQEDEHWKSSLIRFQLLQKGENLPFDRGSVYRILEEGGEVDLSLNGQTFLLRVDWTRCDPFHPWIYTIHRGSSPAELFSGSLEELFSFCFFEKKSLREHFSEFRVRCVFPFRCPPDKSL